MSKLFRLNLRDVIVGLVVALVVVILGALQEAFMAHGLDFASFDWAGILDVAWKTALAYLATSTATDEHGKLMGKI